MNLPKKIKILNKMGIDIWVPSSSELFKKIGSNVKSNSIDPVNTSIKKISADSDKVSLAESDDKKKSNISKKVHLSSDINFTLNMMIFDDLMIIDDVSELNFVKSMYLNWIRSIFFALDHKQKDELNFDYEQFDWPIKNNSIDCTLESAKDVFFSWIKRKKESNDIHQILLMGRATAIISGQPSGYIGQNITMQEFKKNKIFLTFGTTQLWKNPSLKRDFWEHLKIFFLS